MANAEGAAPIADGQTVSVAAGASLKFTLAPDEGAVVESITANGEALAADAEGCYTVSATASVVVVFAAAEEEPEEEEAQGQTIASAPTADGLVFTVHALAGVLPEGAYVTAVPVSAEVQQSAESAIDEALGEGREVAEIVVYDVVIHAADGTEIQPNGEVMVTVSNVPLSATEEGQALEVFHIDDETGAAEKKADVSADGLATFAADSFSLYPVVVTQNTEYDAQNRAGTITLYPGDTYQLEGKVSGSNNYRWVSGSGWNPEVYASGKAQNGSANAMFTAEEEQIGQTLELRLQESKYGIRWTDVSGYSYTIQVLSPVASIAIEGETEVMRGETLQLSAVVETIDPEKYSEDVTWSSSDRSTATVDENGVVTGVKAGTVTITAKAYDKTAEHTVKVFGNVVVSFDSNGGSGSIDSIAGKSGSVITLPTGEALSREGYTFLGWSTGKDASTIPTSGYIPPAVMPAGDLYEVGNEDITLYAVWAQSEGENSDYLWIAIRKDGTIPTEPANQGSGSYEFIGVYNGQTKVDNLLEWFSPLHTVAGSENVMPRLTQKFYDYVAANYELEPGQYIEWYVIKHETLSNTRGWHIDGVVRDKQQLYVDYSPNFNGSNLAYPDGRTYTEGTTVTVERAGKQDGGNWRPLVRSGYTFTGWNTKADGTGIGYQPGDNFTLTKDYVTQNGDGNTVTLYAQWTPLNNITGEIRYQTNDGTVISSETVTNLTVDTQWKATAAVPAGYKLAAGEPSEKTKTVSANASENIIVFVVEKDETDVRDLTYTVEYYKDNELAESETVTKSVWSGTTVMPVDALTKTYAGYDLVSTDPAEWPATTEAGSTLKAYYGIDETQTKTLSYTVNYYKDGEFAENISVEQTVQVLQPDTLTVQPVDTSADRYEGFAFDYTSPAEIPTVIVDGGEINVYYAADEKGTDPENPDKPDNVPDKYQAKVTYQAVNGAVTLGGSMGTELVTYVTLFDADGKWAENGTGKLAEAQVPTAAAAADYDPATERWTPAVPAEGAEITADGAVFTVTWELAISGYQVHYYYDGVEDTASAVNATGKIGDAIPYDTGKTTFDGANYVLENVDGAGKLISKDAAANIVNVNFTKDEKSDPTKDPDPEVPGDNIPDKYQATVTFEAINGVLQPKGGTDAQNTKQMTTVVTLLNENGEPAENGTGYLTEAQIPTALANLGYIANTLFWGPATPTTSYAITGDITFVADFNAEGVIPEEPPVPPVTPVGPTAPEEGPEETIDEPETPLAPAEPEAPAEEPAEEEIEEADTPLASGAAWALLNLILMLCTALVSILLLIGFLGKKKKEDENENVEYTVKRKGVTRVLSLIPAIGSIIAFLLTENMRNPMVFVDRWTWLMVLIALVQVIVCIFARKEKEEPDDNAQTPAQA